MSAASRRTAQLLATTQPGISKVLRNLRAQFADPLFVRNGHAMQPTAKALDIADQLRALLGAADGLRAAVTAFDPAQSERTFSLLLTDVGMIRFLPPLIAHVAAIAPGINIRAMPLDLRQFELKLEAGEADLALGAFPKAARHLRRQRLYFDGYVSVVRNGHPRFSGSAVPHRLPRRAAYPRHGVRDRSCRPHDGAARAGVADIVLRTSCCRSQASSPAPLSRPKPTRSRPCPPIWPSALPARSG